MRESDRAPLAALSVLAAVAGTASVGIAVLAHEGVCVHHLLGRPVPARAMAAMPGGMPMDVAMPHAPGMGGLCPVMVGAAFAAAALYLIAVIALAVLRPRAGEVAIVSARLVLAMRFDHLAAGLALGAAIPLAAAVAAEGGWAGAMPAAAAALVAAAAALAAVLLTHAARAILAFAHRLVEAIAAAFELVAPGAETPWLREAGPVLAVAGADPARRRPSRAPPLRA